MLGLIRWGGEGNVIAQRVQVLGLPMLQVQLPQGGRWEGRRLDRAARLLTGRGVRRVLVPPAFDRWAPLMRRGLTGVDPLPLYRALADRLVLTALERINMDPRQACVALRGEWVDPDLARAARLLCPKVRSLIVQSRWGGEALRRDLYREFGAVALDREGGHVTVRFGGAGQEGELVLCGTPQLLGLTLQVPELTLPEELEPLPLLTALWQTGRLSEERFCVRF